MDEKEIRLIPAMKFAEDWSEIDRLDVTLEAFMKRLSSLEKILLEKGSLNKEEASLAVCGFYLPLKQIKAAKGALDRIIEDQDGRDIVFEATEIAADWARKELSCLREFERDAREDRSKKPETPVLHGNVMGRSELSDLAITMLTIVEKPGNNLTMLLAELMNVDLHRKTLAEKKSNPDYNVAAQLMAQIPDMKPVQLAKAVGRDKSTISRWMKKPDFQDWVGFYREAFSPDSHINKLHKKSQKPE